MNAVLTGNRKWIVQVLSVVLAPQVIFYALFLAEGIVGGLAQGRLADRGAFVWWAQIVVVLSALSMFYSQKGEPAFRLTGRGRRLVVGSSAAHLSLIVLTAVYSGVFGDEVSSTKALSDPNLVFAALNVGMVWLVGVVCSVGQLSSTLNFLVPRSAEPS